MEKKSNKGMYAVIGVLIALVAAAVVIMLVLVFNKEKEKKNISGNVGSAITDEISQSSNDINESDGDISSKDDSKSGGSDKKTTRETGQLTEMMNKMTMDYNGKSTWASFRIPKNFMLETEDSSEGYSTETFLTDDASICVDCYIFASEEYYNSAENYAVTSADWISDDAPENSDLEVKTIEINGNKFYYVEAKYNYSDSEYQRVYAACDINDSAIYAVQAIVIDEDVDLSIDTIKGFLELEFEEYNIVS